MPTLLAPSPRLAPHLAAAATAATAIVAVLGAAVLSLDPVPAQDAALAALVPVPSCVDAPHAARHAAGHRAERHGAGLPSEASAHEGPPT
jgi:hypothetical protein